jgi:hypothetical protein
MMDALFGRIQHSKSATYSKIDTFQKYVNMCKQDINNIKRVPRELATVEFIEEIDPNKLWGIMNMSILNNLAPDAQDYIIDMIWLKSRSFKDKCSEPWISEIIITGDYGELVFKILDNVFSAKTRVGSNDTIPEGLAVDQTLLSYIVDRIASNGLVNFPLSLFKGVQLTSEQFIKLNSVYRIQLSTSDRVPIVFNASTIDELLRSYRGSNNTRIVPCYSIV